MSRGVSRRRRGYARAVELQHRAEELQSRVRGTLGAVRRRLKPTLRATSHYIAENPIPWVMIGIGGAGLAWLFFANRGR